MDSEKLEEIKRILTVQRAASVNELAEKLYVSTATVRRALNILEKDGVLKRTHGGAVSVKNNDGEAAFNARLMLNQPLKRRIAEAASLLIPDNSCVFMDSSSSVGCIVPYLENFTSLKVITNGIRTAYWLSQLKNVSVTIACGEVENYGNSVLGSRTLDFIRTMSFDCSVISTSGVSKNGYFTDAHTDQSEIKKYLLENSAKTVVLADSSKFFKTCLYKTFPCDKPDFLVTDRAPETDFSESLRHCELIVAD